MTLLAQSTPDAGALLSFFQVVFFIVGGLAGLSVIYRNMKGATPQPLEVRENHAAASRKEIDEVHGRIKRERMEIDAAIRDLKEADLRLSEKLDDRLQEMDERIDAVPQRTIELLRNTKGLLT